MITNKDEAKAMTEYISFDCKCKFSSTTFNSKQKWNNKIVWKKITFFHDAFQSYYGLFQVN